MCEVEYHISFGAKPHISISLKVRHISTLGRGPHQFMTSISRVWHYGGGAHISSGLVSAGYGILGEAHISSVSVLPGMAIWGRGPHQHQFQG